MGEHPADDLVLARTLLAAVLAACTDPDLEWAAAVIRTPIGATMVLTSNESRGWLPPGLFLPAEINTPWTWDNVFGSRARRATAHSEGITDPARVFAELSPLVHGKGRRMTALASSAVVTDSVRAVLGADIEMAERVPAARSTIDLSVPGPGLVDRLEIGGSQQLRERAALIPDSEILPTCLRLVHEANTMVNAAVSEGDIAVFEHRAQRQRVLGTLLDGNSIPPNWADEMRATDAMLSAAQRSRRVETSHIPVGVRADSAAAQQYRDIFFERRIGELALLLIEQQPNRQMLREILYTYGQVVDHPLFSENPAVVSVGPDSGIVAPPTVAAPGNGQHAESHSRSVVLPPVAEPWGGPPQTPRETSYEAPALGRTANG